VDVRARSAGIVTTTLLLTAVAAVLLAAQTIGPPSRQPSPPTARRRDGPRRSGRARRQRAGDLADLIDLFIVAAHAGCTPLQAVVEITEAAPVSLRPVLAGIGASLDHGVRFADAVQRIPAAFGPSAQPFADALRLADLYGLPLAPVLDQLATDVRQQRRRQADAAARQLPIRMAAPLVVCHLSSFVVMAIVPLLLGALSSLGTAATFPLDLRSFQ
jgi:Flp pilus assembly protein TadB